MVLVFFVYGLAFFTMGFAIALESRQSSSLRLAASLPFLAAFGILHALVEWADMLLLVESASPPTFDMEMVRLVRTLLLGVSTGALVQFGANLIAAATPRARKLRFVPACLGLAWVVTLLLLATVFPPGTRQWLIHADVWARYLLYLPGSVLAGFGLIREARLLDGTDFRSIARDARFAAATFLLNALVAGLVVPPGQRFPVSPLDYEVFEAIFGLPVQILRAVSALAIAYFVLRVLRVFRIQSARQMEEANLRRLQAQQEALDAQRQARAEMEQWNRELEGRIALRTAEMALRNRQLLAVNSIAASVSQSFDLQQVLEQTLERTLEALEADGGGIFLSSEGGSEPTVQLSRGLPEELVSTISRGRLDAVVAGELAQPVWDASSLPADEGEEGESSTPHPSVRSFLTAPLKAKGRVVGVIGVARAGEPRFGPQDGQLLTAIGHQVGVAVENARLFAQVQKMAVLEERERLAREMHDGLAQVIGFLSIKTRTMRQLVARGSLEQVESDLEQVQRIVQDAYADIRQSILSLRTATELDQGLLAAIRTSASDFTEHSSIPVELALVEEGEVSFSPEAEVQLVRIVQEALANVGKHSGATRVWIGLECHDGEVILVVEDNGVGFDPSRVAARKRRCFGLETMRERAESIGAHLDVAALPDQGTRIKVRYLCERRAPQPIQLP